MSDIKAYFTKISLANQIGNLSKIFITLHRIKYLFIRDMDVC